MLEFQKGANIVSRSTTMAQLPAELPSIKLPEHEILELGNDTPDARAVFTAESADQGACAGFWSCDVGKYEFLFDYDEFVYLISGEVIVTETVPPTNRSFVLRA